MDSRYWLPSWLGGSKLQLDYEISPGAQSQRMLTFDSYTTHCIISEEIIFELDGMSKD